MRADERKLVAVCKHEGLDQLHLKAALILGDIRGLEPALEFLRYAGVSARAEATVQEIGIVAGEAQS
jgi:hypothetical protein